MLNYLRVILSLFVLFIESGCRSFNDDIPVEAPEFTHASSSTIVVFDKDYIWQIGTNLTLPRGGVIVRLKEISKKEIIIQGVPINEFTTDEEIDIPNDLPIYFRWGNNVQMNIQKIDSEYKWVRVRFVRGVVVM